MSYGDAQEVWKSHDAVACSQEASREARAKSAGASRCVACKQADTMVILMAIKCQSHVKMKKTYDSGASHVS